MRIKKLTLEHFGPHKRVAVDCSDASRVGIVGRNGYGKSTILAALGFLFTGFLQDKNASYIRRPKAGERKKAAEVSALFEHEGREGFIERRLTESSSSVSLVWNGEDAITSASGVAAKIAELVGASRNALGSSVFIPQGTLDKMFYGTPAERFELFAALLNIGHIEPARAKIDVLIKKEQATVVDHRDTAAAATENRVRLETALGEAEAKLYAAFGPDDSVRLTTLSSLLRDCDNIRFATEDLARLFLELEAATGHFHAVQCPPDAEAQIAAEEKAINRDTEILRRCSSRQDILSGIAAPRAARSQLFRNVLPATNEVNRLLTELDTAKTTLSSLGDPAVLENRLRRSRELLEVKKRLQTADIPLTTKATELAEAREKLKGAHAALITATDALRGAEQVKALVDSTHALLSLASKSQHAPDGCPLCASQGYSLASVTEKLKQAEKVRLDAGNSVITNLAAHKAAQAQVNTLAAQEKNTQEAWTVLETRRLKDVGTLDSLEKELGHVPTEAELEELQGVLGKITNGKTEVNRLSAALKTAETNLHATRTELDKARALVDAGEAQLLRPEFQGLPEASTEAELRFNLPGRSSALLGLKAAFSRKQEAETRLNTLREQARDRQDKLEAEKTRVGIVDTARISEEIVELTAKRDASIGLESAVATLKAEIKVARSTEAKLQTLINANLKKQAVIDTLVKIQTALGPNGISLHYTQAVFSALVVLAAGNLSRLAVDFSLAVDTDQPLAMKFLRSGDDEWLPQNKLSGGQKVNCSIAMLLAIQQLVCPNIGLLCLDEPSMHLDNDAVDSLCANLVNLSGSSEDGSAQLWICDHKPELESVYETVIRVPSCVEENETTNETDAKTKDIGEELTEENAGERKPGKEPGKRTGVRKRGAGGKSAPEAGGSVLAG